MRSAFSLCRKMVWGGSAILATALAASPAMGGYTLKTVVSFSGQNGATPFGGLIADASGNLYGTTLNGGANSLGAVFEVLNGTSNIVPLASFNDRNAASPFSGVVLDSSGNIYGSTSKGGTLNDGAVYEIPHGTNTVDLLASFTGTNGRNPFGGVVVDSSGNVYGTTQEGGPNGNGTVFEVVNGSGVASTIHAFGTLDGSGVYAGLTSDASGNLYGASFGGGADGEGTVFEIPAGTSNLTTVASFTGYSSGVAPWSAPVLDSAGNLYGTTFAGDPASPRVGGAVYEIVKGSSVATALGEFAPPNGLVPTGEVAIDAAGDIFGTTEAGGAFDNYQPDISTPGDGTVFEIPAGTNTVITLLSFDGTDGAGPQGGLYIDAAGNLFGTASEGGANGAGTFFELSPTVPEPGSLAMLAAVGLLIPRRRFRGGSMSGA